MPKVSVVLPNYNYARYLDERIQSLLNQTYQDFELIILDDASTDNSIEVINKYIKDSRVKTQFYTENSGLPYKRWNDGADLAQGEYLLIAGADDSCHPTLLEKLVEKLDKHPDVGLAYSQSWGIDSEGKQTFSWKGYTDPLDKDRWANDFINKGTNELKYLFNRNTILNASAVLMRRQLFIEAGKFDLELHLTADWKLWSKILMISDIAFIAEHLNYFRTHKNTVRMTTASTGLDIEEFYKTRKYIFSNLNYRLTKQDIDLASNETLENWFNLLFKQHIQVDIKRNIRIYQIANSIDPQLNFKLLKKFTFHLIEAIKQPIRAIKHKLIYY